MRLLFWKKKNKGWISTGFTHTVPKGRWQIEEQWQVDPKGNSQHVIIYKPAPANQRKRVKE